MGKNNTQSGTEVLVWLALGLSVDFLFSRSEPVVAALDRIGDFFDPIEPTET